LTDRVVTYRVTVPESALGTAIFSGNVSASGASSSTISGDVSVTVGPYIVNATRHLPVTAYTNSAYTIRISLDVDESNKPSSLGLTEYVPAGMNVSSISAGGAYFPASGRIDWLLSGTTNPVEDRNLTYAMDVPAGASTGNVSFDGVVEIAGSQNSSIGGDSYLTISQGCSARGDVPPCNVARVSEVLNVIQDWASGNASISEVLALILIWANS
jgi:hypothetical protein